MPLAEADAIITDILQLLEEVPNVVATWTPREGNNLAHQLAAMAAGNQLQRPWTVIPPVHIRNIIRTEAGFATPQHNQHNQNQDNQVSVSTSLQGCQRDEGLPGRVEMETWDRHAAEGEERFQPTALPRPINDTSRDTINIASGGDATGLTTEQKVARQRSSSGNIKAVRPVPSGRTQVYHQELHRGRSSAPGDYGRPRAEELRIGAGEITEEGPLRQQLHASSPRASHGGSDDIGGAKTHRLRRRTEDLRLGSGIGGYNRLSNLPTKSK
ncbi:uncharacterized protein DS421_7g200990 [Arachis hypogaea]|nr:uncharacterized protein DS421_7g200990 [Arachis hypogaea]